MNLSELLVGLSIAALLTGLALYYGRRQLKTLESLRSPDLGWTPEDRRYISQQARRRLWCSALMLLFAAMLVGWFFLEQAKPPQEPGQDRITPEQEAYAWQVTIYFGLMLLVLFGIFLFAALDIVAIGRFARRKQRQLEADRQAVIQDHAARYRRQRNGESI